MQLAKLRFIPSFDISILLEILTYRVADFHRSRSFR